MINPQGVIGGQPTTILPGEAPRAVPRHPAIEQPRLPSELMHKDWVALRGHIADGIGACHGDDSSADIAESVLKGLEAAGWELRLNRKTT